MIFTFRHNPESFFKSMFIIMRLIAPFKIFQPIISFASIFMINLSKILGVIQKMFCYQAMNIMRFWFTILTQIQDRIAYFSNTALNYFFLAKTSNCSAITISTTMPAGQTPYHAIIVDLIMFFITLYWFPNYFFHRNDQYNKTILLGKLL